MKFLDPKADLTFKKIFGKHPDLLIKMGMTTKQVSEATGINE